MSEPALREFLNDLEVLGVNLELSGEQLRCEAPEGVLTPELRVVLAERKPEIIQVLQGKALIRETLNRIADAWSEIEHSGGSPAWEWILRSSSHGNLIRQAEDRVDAIGSRGDPAVLKAACDAWLLAWSDGIEAWERRFPAKGADGTKQISLIF
jgi:hypothetical protein